MATPKPGPRPEPSPPIPTIETEVSPLHPEAALPIPTIQADVSPIRSDGSASIGIFTPEALAPVIPAPKLPASKQGLPSSKQAVLRSAITPSAAALPMTMTGDAVRAISTPSGPPALAPWCSPSAQMHAASLANQRSDSAPTLKPPAGIVDRALLSPLAAPPTVKEELGTVGPYHLRELIGEGGMGLVYRAEDSFLKRPVALKIMRPDVAKDERAWKRFLIEAQATAALKNDRIATIYQIGEDNGQFYLAMELLSGEPLESRLRRGPMPIRLVLWVAREAALGLAVAHDAGFIHRDIKPGNLWLETKPGAGPAVDPLHRFRNEHANRPLDPSYLRVKILDFGLVRLGHDEIGRNKSIVGTPAYMAPEQAAGHGSDARSDIFSLGVVLFRMLTGQLPFQGETTMELLTALSSQPAPPVTKYNPMVPPALTNLVARMLSRDPAARPATAANLAREIEVIERTILAPKTLSRKSRRQTIIIGAAMIAALAVFAGGWALWNNRTTSEDTLATTVLPAKAILTPSEAAQVIGDQVRVEFVVGVVERAGDVAYLYESAPKSDDVTFRVTVPQHIILAMRKRGSYWPDVLKGSRLRLQGQVSREGKFAEILIGDPTQFEKILYNDVLTTSTPSK